MSKISDAYDALVSELVALFPDKMQLQNAIDLDSNTAEQLRDGFGIAIGPAINSNRHVSCKLSVLRDITVILTVQSFAKPLETTEKYDTIKALLEDQAQMIQKYEQSPVLGASVAKFLYQSDIGIEHLVAGEEKYYKIETLFKMEYFENL